MAHLAEEVISGPLRDWLAAQRPALNGRFRMTRQRYPKLDVDAFLALCREFLPAVAGQDVGEAGELLHAVYDLLLLHAARGTLAPQTGGGGSLPGIRTLFTETFPRLRKLLLARPRSLPGALSNAVENMGPSGVEFARRLAEVGAVVDQPDTLLDAGAVLAWRLGDARLRSASLRIGQHLESALFLRLLGLGDWPAAAAPLVAEGLAADGWQLPEKRFSPATLAALERMTPAERAALGQRPVAAAKKPSWVIAGRLGHFRGFGGAFSEPPILLASGPDRNRHCFWVQCGRGTYRIDGDAFGWVCRPDAVRFPRCSARVKSSADLPAATTSALALDDLVAFTRSDSFRVRILLPAGEPL
jgi:hypothetical protein